MIIKKKSLNHEKKLKSDLSWSPKTDIINVKSSTTVGFKLDTNICQLWHYNIQVQERFFKIDKARASLFVLRTRRRVSLAKLTIYYYPFVINSIKLLVPGVVIQLQQNCKHSRVGICNLLTLSWNSNCASNS